MKSVLKIRKRKLQTQKEMERIVQKFTKQKADFIDRTRRKRSLHRRLGSESLLFNRNSRADFQKDANHEIIKAKHQLKSSSSSRLELGRGRRGITIEGGEENANNSSVFLTQTEGERLKNNCFSSSKGTSLRNLKADRLSGVPSFRAFYERNDITKKLEPYNDYYRPEQKIKMGKVIKTFKVWIPEVSSLNPFRVHLYKRPILGPEIQISIWEACFYFPMSTLSKISSFTPPSSPSIIQSPIEGSTSLLFRKIEPSKIRVSSGFPIKRRRTINKKKNRRKTQKLRVMGDRYSLRPARLDHFQSGIVQ